MTLCNGYLGRLFMRNSTGIGYSLGGIRKLKSKNTLNWPRFGHVLCVYPLIEYCEYYYEQE